MKSEWPKIQEILRQSISPGLYQVWIKPLQAATRGDILELTAPNEFVAVWVRDRLLESITKAASRQMGRPVTVQVAAQPGDSTPAASPALGAEAAAPMVDAGATSAWAGVLEKARDTQTARPGSEPHPREQAGLPLSMRVSSAGKYVWRHSFDDFVVGPSNRVAHAAAQSLCEQTLNAQQLFISSGPGLGKTHLLQAVGKRMCQLSNRQCVRLEYLTAEEFVRQLHMAIRSKEVERFKARYRDTVDLLLLEDIHFLQGKVFFQDELLNTLKALGDRGARVVFTSSFLPRELRDVDKQLTSRFCAGFMAAIEKPDLETRRRIIEHKARVHQIILPDDVAMYLADHIQADIRQLESCLNNLVFKARLLNMAVNMELAREVAQDYATEYMCMNMDRIVDFVCQSYDISPVQLSSKSRKSTIVMARNTAYFLARKYTELSLKDIGSRFNRRHSTVLKGISNVERELNMETPRGRQFSRVLDMAAKFKRG